MSDSKICYERCYECKKLKKIDAKDKSCIYYCKEKNILVKIFLPDDKLKEKKERISKLIYPYAWYKQTKKELDSCEQWLKNDKLKKLEILDRYNKSRRPKSIKKASVEDPKSSSLEDLKNKYANICMDLLMLYADLHKAFKGKDIQLESFEEKMLSYRLETIEKLEKLKKSMLIHDLTAIATVPQKQIVKFKSIESFDILIAGYTMENLQGWWKLSEILSLDFRRKNRISLKDISLIFIKIHHAIKMIHEKGFLIGNLSARNILVKPKKNWHSSNFVEIKIINTDNWGINRPDIDLVWEPLALINEITHPKRMENIAKEKPALPFSQKEDWWSFAYLLAYYLLSFDPFMVGRDAQKGFNSEEKVADGITAWSNSHILTDRRDIIATVRIGSKIGLLLDLWLRCQIEGEFPSEVMFELYGGIIRCKNKSCGMQFHKSISSCPNCGTIA